MFADLDVLDLFKEHRSEESQGSGTLPGVWIKYFMGIDELGQSSAELQLKAEDAERQSQNKGWRARPFHPSITEKAPHSKRRSRVRRRPP